MITEIHFFKKLLVMSMIFMACFTARAEKAFQDESVRQELIRLIESLPNQNGEAVGQTLDYITFHDHQILTAHGDADFKVMEILFQKFQARLKGNNDAFQIKNLEHFAVLLNHLEKRMGHVELSDGLLKFIYQLKVLHGALLTGLVKKDPQAARSYIRSATESGDAQFPDGFLLETDAARALLASGEIKNVSQLWRPPVSKEWSAI